MRTLTSASLSTQARSHVCFARALAEGLPSASTKVRPHHPGPEHHQECLHTIYGTWSSTPSDRSTRHWCTSSSTSCTPLAIPLPNGCPWGIAVCEHCYCCRRSSPSPTGSRVREKASGLSVCHQAASSPRCAPLCWLKCTSVKAFIHNSP